MPLASLPMYDLPEVAAATDAIWSGLARAMAREGVPDVPAHLTRGPDSQKQWLHPALLFSQTCGYPLTHALSGRVRVVATPAYDCTGCDGPGYSSAIVVRADDPARGLEDLRGRCAAVNTVVSQSGYSALRAAVTPFACDGRFFGRVVESGWHAASMVLVQDGEADVCAVDCVTHALLARHRPAAVEGLRVLTWSAVAPGLPYVTRATADDDLLARLRAGLFAMLDDPDLAAARDAVFLAGAEVLSETAYERILDLERDAEACGYAQLA